MQPMVLVYLATKLGDLCWANVGKYSSTMGCIFWKRCNKNMWKALALIWFYEWLQDCRGLFLHSVSLFPACTTWFANLLSTHDTNPLVSGGPRGVRDGTTDPSVTVASKHRGAAMIKRQPQWCSGNRGLLVPVIMWYNGANQRVSHGCHLYLI